MFLIVITLKNLKGNRLRSVTSFTYKSIKKNKNITLFNDLLPMNEADKDHRNKLIRLIERSLSNELISMILLFNLLKLKIS